MENVHKFLEELVSISESVSAKGGVDHIQGRVEILRKNRITGKFKEKLFFLFVSLKFLHTLARTMRDYPDHMAWISLVSWKLTRFESDFGSTPSPIPL